MKYNSICIVGVPENEERQQGIKKLIFKMVPDNLSNMMETKKTHKSRKQERPTPRHIIIKMVNGKDKKKIFKAAGEIPLSTRELP